MVLRCRLFCGALRATESEWGILPVEYEAVDIETGLISISEMIESMREQHGWP